MAGRKHWKNAKEKVDGGQFSRMPLSVLNSRAYVECSPHARMLLIDLFMQYRGDNNGDLACPWKLMRERGWKSEATLQKAKRQLLDVGLIVETRMGARPNKASLYAVTWCDLDPCGGKLEVQPKHFPRGAYRLRDPVPPLRPAKNDVLAPLAVVGAAG